MRNRLTRQPMTLLSASIIVVESRKLSPYQSSPGTPCIIPKKTDSCLRSLRSKCFVSSALVVNHVVRSS
jgi:hypothetical protein